MRHLFVVFAAKQTPIDERFIDGIIKENVGECAVNNLESLLNVTNIKLQTLPVTR
jgi:hypothetical protein